jgi:hypothetical protein
MKMKTTDPRSAPAATAKSARQPPGLVGGESSKARKPMSDANANTTAAVTQSSVSIPPPVPHASLSFGLVGREYNSRGPYSVALWAATPRCPGERR